MSGQQFQTVTHCFYPSWSPKSCTGKPTKKLSEQDFGENNRDFYDYLVTSFGAGNVQQKFETGMIIHCTTHHNRMNDYCTRKVS
jgi:hypothetical protein